MLALLALLITPGILAENFTILCNDILQYPDEKSLTMEELKSIPTEEVNECLLALGKGIMPAENAKVIWSSLLNYYEDASNIPDDKLMVLHWVSAGIEPSHYENLTLSNIDVVENFGLFYDLSEEQLKAVADRVQEDWSNKDPEDYTSYDLTALKQILCAFNTTILDRIHPVSYRDAASALGDLRKCPRSVLEALGRLAVDEKAFGPADKWDENTITAVGVVMDGLPEDILATIPKALLQLHRNMAL